MKVKNLLTEEVCEVMCFSRTQELEKVWLYPSEKQLFNEKGKKEFEILEPERWEDTLQYIKYIEQKGLL